ncbi:MAG: sterol desaturase family protein [Acidimicrobiales bacterium]|nr:sterol desaturase family protein [Acidimicrobiales bacterium]
MHLLIAALAIGLALLIDRGTLGVLVVLFVLVVPFEKLFPRHRSQKLRRPGAGTDIAFALVNPLVNVAGIVVAVIVGVLSLAWVPGLLLRPVVAALPPWAVPIVGLALFDLAIYWAHRWAHEVGALWRFHKIHHSAATLDWVSGFRNHPIDGVIIGPAVLLLLAAGFSGEATGVFAVIQIVTGIFLHANVRWRWRPLHRVVATPDFHHWHHADDPLAHHTNYAAFLPLWDIVFGTYRVPRDQRPERYGVSEPLPTTVVGLLREPLRGMGNPLRVVRHPWRSVRRGLAFARVLLREVWAVSRRPTHHLPRPAS